MTRCKHTNSPTTVLTHIWLPYGPAAAAAAAVLMENRTLKISDIPPPPTQAFGARQAEHGL